MNSQDIDNVAMVRKRRLRNAERVLNEAKRLEAAAQGAVHRAEAGLDAFDRDMELRIARFFERARSGIDPSALTAMRAFRIEQMPRREALVAGIGEARLTLAGAQAATAQARAFWQSQMLAAENLQGFAREQRLTELKALLRRSESEADELAGSKCVRSRSE